MFALKRSFTDRRSGKERRKILRLDRLRYKGTERRADGDRREPVERRAGWVRITRWSSANFRSLKIARYLQRP